MIHVDRGGDGEALFLLLHGLGATGAVWLDVGAGLSRYGRWLAVDLPGHGASTRRDLYSMGSMAAELAPLVANERRVYVVGHSLGAYVGLALASGWFGVRMSGVLGIGPKITWTQADLDGVRELAARPPRTFDTEAEAVARYRRVSGLDEAFARPAHLARGVVEIAERYGLAADPRTMLVAGASFSTLARSAQCRVILARGQHDPMVTLAELRAHAADACELAGVGHNAHVEDAAATLAFCARLAEPA
jgi:pimeloyl-ACP methyl ester carboxylesterase